MTRRAKIVCTLGPASHSPDEIRALVEAGMDVARLNLSHGSHAEHRHAYDGVRRASDQVGRAVAILADLQGPKIRLGEFPAGPVELEAGQPWLLTTEAVPGDARRGATSYANLARDVKPGDLVLIDDGLVKLEVIDTDGVAVRTRVVEGGRVSDHKGINLPGVSVSVPPLTDKDVEDLRFALGLAVDLVALSFVRHATDADVARRVMDEAGLRVPLIAKIEKPEAVIELRAILRAFDGLMVARGDLGVEMALEQVPLVQRSAVELGRRSAKPVIVATQMLDSMIQHSRPTRAEASDVANAVLEGADALMLSGETSVGRHPVLAVRTMDRIIRAAEEGRSQPLPVLPPPEGRERSRQEAIAAAAVRVASEVDARALVAFTRSGSTAVSLARHRGEIPLLAFTIDPAVRSRLALVWGVETFVVPPVEHTDEMVQQVEQAMLALGRAHVGDLVVVVAGMPPNVPGSTNTMRVHRLGSR